MFSFYCKSFLFLSGKPFQRALSATQIIFIQAMQSIQASGEGNSGQQSIGRLVCSSSFDWLDHFTGSQRWKLIGQQLTQFSVWFAWCVWLVIQIDIFKMILDNKKRNQNHQYSVFMITINKTVSPSVNKLNINAMNKLSLMSKTLWSVLGPSSQQWSHVGGNQCIGRLLLCHGAGLSGENVFYGR